MTTETFMQKALELAEKSITAQTGGPFGAVVVKDGEIIGQGRNEVTIKNDPSAHAEIMAIRDACKTLKAFSLEGCTLYTTCEPCPMCLSATYWAHIDTIVYAAKREDAAQAGFIDQHIYDELAKPVTARKIELKQIMEKDARDILQKWSALPGKQGY